MNLGCEPADFDVDSCELVYINSVGAHGWCDTLSVISSAYMKAELRSKFTNKPTKMAFVVSDIAMKKRKPTDSYTSLERIEYLIENFVTPTNGIIGRIYIVSLNDEEQYLKSDYTTVTDHIEWPFQTNTVWKLKHQWTPRNYVTFQRTEGNSFTKERNALIEQKVLRALEELDVDVRFVDYTMHPRDVVDTLQGSLMHFSYVGATWWLTHYMGVPVIDYGEHTHQSISDSIFGVLGAPGGSKNRAQFIYENGAFGERKHKAVCSYHYDQEPSVAVATIKRDIIDAIVQSN